MKMNEGMTCTSCSRPKAELKATQSVLMPDMTLYMCGECIELKREPRFVVIIVGRMSGWESVRQHIKEARYVGDPIEAADLL